MTKKLSQEFSETENHFLSALSRLDEFPLSPQARVHSWPVSELSQNSNRENQGTNENRSQSAPHPEVGVSLSQSSHELSPEDTSYRNVFGHIQWDFMVARKATFPPWRILSKMLHVMCTILYAVNVFVCCLLIYKIISRRKTFFHFCKSVTFITN